MFLDGDGALCVQPVQVTVLSRLWWREELVQAHYLKKTATEASVLLPWDNPYFDILHSKLLAQKRWEFGFDENLTKAFVCVINARGEALALSPLRDLQKLDLQLLDRSKYTGIDTFSFKVDVTPLALLLDAYCKARAPRSKLLEAAARTCANSFTNSRTHSHV